MGGWPSYQMLPWTSRHGRIISLSVRGDPAKLAALVPHPLEPLGNGVAHVWAVDLEAYTGAGGYQEVLMAIPATFNGEPGVFSPWLYVNNDVSVMLGREVMGTPKKYARVEIRRADDQLNFTVERAGVKIVHGGMALREEYSAQRLAELRGAMGGAVWGVMGSVAGPDGDPSPARMVLETRSDREIHRAVAGDGFLHFAASAADPLFELGSLTVRRATYLELGTTLKPTKVRGVFPLRVETPAPGRLDSSGVPGGG